jgi:hypothetical protein
MKDFGYNAHRRTVKGIAGLTEKGRKPFVTTESVTILENRVDGQVRSVTVLSDNGPFAKAVTRLDGASARY